MCLRASTRVVVSSDDALPISPQNWLSMVDRPNNIFRTLFRALHIMFSVNPLGRTFFSLPGAWISLSPDTSPLERWWKKTGGVTLRHVDRSPRSLLSVTMVLCLRDWVADAGSDSLDQEPTARWQSLECHALDSCLTRTSGIGATRLTTIGHCQRVRRGGRR